MTIVSHHTALIYVMVVVSAADGAMSASEIKKIGDLVKSLPVFRDFELLKLLPTTQDCTQMLREPDGYATVLRLVKQALPAHLCETAYCLALEVALADRRLALEEIQVFDTVRRELGIDKLVAAAIERAMKSRYQLA